MADRYQNRTDYPADDSAGHASHPARHGGEGDPLAELARLIGQADPFNNFGRDGRPAPTRDTSFGQHADDRDDVPLASDRPAWMQRMQQHQAAESHEAPHQTHAEDEAYRQSPPFAPSADAQHDPSRYDNVLFGEADQGYAQHPDTAHQQAPNFADDPYGYHQDGYGAESEAEPEQKPRRSGLLTVVAVIALGIVGTVGAYAYRSFVSSPRSGEPPVIKADTGPTKIVPPTTQSADGSKLIYDRIGQGGERVVSREEQPLDVNSKSGARVVLPQFNQPGAAAPGTASSRTAAAPAAAAQGEEPRKVRTLSIRPDQAEPAPAPAPAKPPPTAAKPAPRVVSPPPSANANASATGPVSLTPPSQGQTAPPVRTASTAPSGGTGNYVVQVSSQRSEADAQASYRALQGKYPSVLGSRSAAIRRADLGDKGVYYRAMVGPFGSSEDATRLCESLKAAGGQCNIMRN